ncbi:MAG: DUF309 domain-containing protein [Pararhizobium sp.]
MTVTATLDSDEFAWGQDLFNFGWYWEAHEAWEGLWQVADRGTLRAMLNGLMLPSAAGVRQTRRSTGPAEFLEVDFDGRRLLQADDDRRCRLHPWSPSYEQQCP